MDIYSQLLQKQTKMSLIGLGYVGLPIAVAFSKHLQVIGFDVNSEKIQKYVQGIDPTQEVGSEAVMSSTVEFTSNPEKLREALFHIVAVPTPVNEDNKPNLTPVESASKILGQNLMPGSIVVFESTVFPGVTEEICVPIIERESGLKCGFDFKVGYSPERINPGDKKHTLENIIKVVSGMDEMALDTIAKVYELVVKAGVYRAKSIKVAEAAKVIENSQRDINIAFMNELSIIFHKLGIDTRDVLDAAKTKWNFLDFVPGLVGGHCIGVDPYYLTYKAEQHGYQSQVILSGRRINDGMGKYVSEQVIKKMVEHKISVLQAKVVILGFTFKENVPDTRNTRVIDIVRELNEYSINPIIIDPVADKSEALHEYGVEINSTDRVNDADVVILTVGHDVFKKLSPSELSTYYKLEHNPKLLFDLKGLLNLSEFTTSGFEVWRL